MARNDDRPHISLQQKIIEVLVWCDKEGAQVASLLSHTEYDSVFQEFVRRVMNYRNSYGRPPEHYVEDIADALRDNPVVQDRLLPELLLVPQRGLNPEYVLSRVGVFALEQRQKAAIHKAADIYSQGAEDRSEQVSKLFADVLAFQAQEVDPGVFLRDEKDAKEWGDRILGEVPDTMFPIGIDVLDNLKVGAREKELLLYIAPKNSGKTWFCVHMARQALLHKKNVLHISLEMGVESMMRRYTQCFYGVARSTDEFRRPELKFDKYMKDKVVGFDMESMAANKTFDSSVFLKKVDSHMIEFVHHNGALVLRQFPTGGLSMDRLLAYLDLLEKAKGFIPNVLIVDYPDLMEKKGRDYRIEIGDIFEGMRGIAVSRNMAVIAPTQGNRATIGAKRVRSSDAAEDIRKVNIADTVLTFSRTEKEASHGLGRLYLNHARDAPVGLEIVIGQSYTTGQYVRGSGMMHRDYWEAVKDFEAGDEDS